MHSQAEFYPSHQLRVLEMFGRKEETILGKKPGGQCPSYLVLLMYPKIIPKRSEWVLQTFTGCGCANEYCLDWLHSRVSPKPWGCGEAIP